MIRINLLGVERQKTRRSPAFDIGQRITAACSLILVVATLGIGWWYWSLTQASARVDAVRKGQSIPVQMLDQVSRSLPEMLWLTTMRQEGADVTIEGRSTTLMGLSDFVGNLSANGFFKKPIEIVDSQVEAAANGSQAGPDLIRFTVKAQLATPVASAAKK
jgi:type IV pilus assembly protein PilN